MYVHKCSNGSGARRDKCPSIRTTVTNKEIFSKCACYAKSVIRGSAEYLEYRCTSRKTANVIQFVTPRIAKANGLLTSDVCEFEEEFDDDREVELPTRSTELKERQFAKAVGCSIVAAAVKICRNFRVNRLTYRYLYANSTVSCQFREYKRKSHACDYCK
jgi:hypothetical protein